MPNGHDMRDELEFEKEIENFSKESQFLARQQYKTNVRCAICLTEISQIKADNIRQDGEIKTLQEAVCTPSAVPTSGKKQILWGAGSGGLVAIIFSAIDYIFIKIKSG